MNQILIGGEYWIEPVKERNWYDGDMIYLEENRNEKRRVTNQ